MNYLGPTEWGTNDCLHWILGKDAARPAYLGETSDESEGIIAAVKEHGSLRKATQHQLKEAGFTEIPLDTPLQPDDRVEMSFKSTPNYNVGVIGSDYLPVIGTTTGLQVPTEPFIPLGIWRKEED